MTAKEYLKQYRDKRFEIICIKEEMKELQAIAEYTSPGTESGGNGGISDRVGIISGNVIDKGKDTAGAVCL